MRLRRVATAQTKRHVCLVYDCLYPHTIGGAERWYRNLGDALAAAGHRVTYLTLRQWPEGETAQVPNVDVVAVGPRMALYGAGGNRRVLPPIVFGLGVLWHLLRHGRRYDAIHTASFPYFSLLAIGLLQPIHHYRVSVDWFEFWSFSYWTRYLGRLGGRIGWLVQGLCLRLPQNAFCFSILVARRLTAQGLRARPEILRGLCAQLPTSREPSRADPVVLFAGRHIPEKQAAAIVPALALAVAERPDLRALILGDGPARGEVLDAVDREGLGDRIDVPGFVSAETMTEHLARALCLIHPSEREGYGLVVVEAAALGTPSILVRGADNAATELVEDGVNGFVADSASPEALAEAILRVAAAGHTLRLSTAAWFGCHASSLSLASSLDRVVASYRADPAG